MGFFAIKNFKDGDKVKGWKHYLIGQDYNGPNSESLMKAGVIADKQKSVEAQANVLKLQVLGKQKEIVVLEDKIKHLLNPTNVKPDHKPEPAKPAEHGK